MCGAILTYAHRNQSLTHTGPQKIIGKIQTNHFPIPDIAVLSTMQERVAAGLAAARRRGNVGGRPRALEKKA